MEDQQDIDQPKVDSRHEIIQQTEAFMKRTLTQDASLTNAVVIMFNNDGMLLHGSVLVPPATGSLAGAILLGVLEHFKLNVHNEMNRDKFQKIFRDFIDTP